MKRWMPTKNSAAQINEVMVSNSSSTPVQLPSKLPDRLLEPRNRRDFEVELHALARPVRLRNDRALEALLRRFEQALFPALHRPDLAGEPDFAEDDDVARQRL